MAESSKGWEFGVLVPLTDRYGNYLEVRWRRPWFEDEAVHSRSPEIEWNNQSARDEHDASCRRALWWRLGELGRDGWQVASASGDTWYLQRRL